MKETLWLGENPYISGTIPTEIGKLSNLDDLRLNGLTNMNPPSQLPSEIGKLTSLRVLNVSQTPLAGTLPTEIWSLRGMVNLDLSGVASSTTTSSSSSSFVGGTIPTTIDKLSDLSILQLRDAAMAGTLPSKLGSLAKLQTLGLQRNSFVGSIPTEICNLRGPYGLEELIADCNMTAPLPSGNNNDLTLSTICPNQCCSTCCNPSMDSDVC